MSESKLCDPKCREFKCVKRALTFRGKTPWCNWTSEPCDPKGCTYAVCAKRQLLDNGVCGMKIKRKTRDDLRPEDVFKDEIKPRGKLARKIGERSIF